MIGPLVVAFNKIIDCSCLILLQEYEKDQTEVELLTAVEIRIVSCSFAVETALDNLQRMMKYWDENVDGIKFKNPQALSDFNKKYDRIEQQVAEMTDILNGHRATDPVQEMTAEMNSNMQM